jgi:pimeloyl-ACP methyl ester carboxylesterase
MSGYFFEYKGTKLHFTKSGNGRKILLAFHGFGQDHHAFVGLSKKLAEDFTVFAFDMFFHGKSEWNKREEPLEKSFWKGLLLEFLKQHQIDRFSLLGFSMGGKFVLSSLEAFPEKIDRIFLLAPDGIKTNAWYSLATYPLALRSLFKSMILKPKRFQFIATLAHKIGIIDKSVLRFTESQMNTEAKRQCVYFSWVVFRHLKFKMSMIAHLINSNNIDLTVIVGKYDIIITTKNMDQLLKKLPKHTLEILDVGHNGLLSKWMALPSRSQNDIQY